MLLGKKIARNEAYSGEINHSPMFPLQTQSSDVIIRENRVRPNRVPGHGVNRPIHLEMLHEKVFFVSLAVGGDHWGLEQILKKLG